MKEIADDVYQIPVFPFDSINVYIIEDVLVDAGVWWSRRRIQKSVREVSLKAHVLTHAHADHQGASRAICEALDIPLWCGADDAWAMETGKVVEQYPDPNHWVARFQDRFWAGPSYPVERQLEEGDTVAGFEVLETPGHSPGHLSLYREADRTLILGDVLLNMDLLTTCEGLREPPSIFTPDPRQNRKSAKRLGQLQPELVCFGHGPPLRNSDRFAAFCRHL